MKTFRRFGAILMLMMLVVLIPVQGVLAKTTKAKDTPLKDVRKAVEAEGQWETNSKGVRFLTVSGKYIKSSWIRSDGNIYYLNSQGYRARGWVLYRKNYYYMDKNGKMYTGWLKDRYYLKRNGIRAKSLTKIGKNTYFFNSKTGKKQTGWITVKKKKYYFLQTTGRMARGVWVKAGTDWLYVNAEGVLQKNRWITLGTKTYYLNSKGARLTGEQYIKGKWYYFDSRGVYDPKVKLTSAVYPSKKMVALTFDDGPGPYTDRLLSCLKKNNARATFFMVGTSVDRYKSTIKKMVKQKCELGNHSFDHANLTQISTAAVQSEMTRTSQKIKAACGKVPTVARLPYGAGNNNSSVLNALGLPSIYWSIDTRDWANTGNPQHTVNEVLNNVQDGDIILMHDIHQSSVQAAETIIPALKKKGYQLVTVSELAKYKGKTSLRTGKTYYNFR